MNVLLVQCYVCSSLRRYPPSILMYRSKMGANRSRGCATRGSYCGEEEEGESNMCYDPSFSKIGIRYPSTLTIIVIVG